MRMRNAPGISRKTAPAADLKLRKKLQAARLYVITPDVAPDQIVEIAVAAQRGGADIVQLRDKMLGRRELLTLARRLRELLTDSLFIVNDHVDIAVLSEADGVHLGQDDLSVAAARRVAANRLIIGASVSAELTAVHGRQVGAASLGSGLAD